MDPGTEYPRHKASPISPADHVTRDKLHTLSRPRPHGPSQQACLKNPQTPPLPSKEEQKKGRTEKLMVKLPVIDTPTLRNGTRWGNICVRRLKTETAITPARGRYSRKIPQTAYAFSASLRRPRHSFRECEDHQKVGEKL